MGKPNGLHTQGYDLSVEPVKTKLAYPDQYFDAIVDVLYICRETQSNQVFDELHRLLKRGGRLFSVVPKFTSDDEAFQDIDSIQFFPIEVLRRCFNGKFKYKINSLEHTPDVTESKTIRFWLVDALKVM